MAKQTVITDDITGEPGAETHVIVVDGKGIEIDLADKSAKALVKALAPYWAAGSEGDYQVIRQLGRRKGAVGLSPAMQVGVTDAQVREWAGANNVACNTHGRVPKQVVEQYLRANGHR